MANSGLPKLIKRQPDRFVRKMDHQVPRQPCIDARKAIVKYVELHEFGIGISVAVVGDEVVNDVSPDISEAGWPVDILHPMEVAAWGIQQRLNGMAAYEFGQLSPDRDRPRQFGAPAAAALAVVPPVSPEDIGEDLFRIIGTKTVHRHPLVDDRTQPGRRVIPDRCVKPWRMPFQQ